MDEQEIYVSMKEFLERLGWDVLGGEPPDGTNVIPRIEIKDPYYRGKGSRGSKKIDLISHKAGFLLLTELKSIYDAGDVEKLNRIVADQRWRESLVEALQEKRAFDRLGIDYERESYTHSSRRLVKSVGHLGPSRAPKDFITFLVQSRHDIRVVFGACIPVIVRALFQRMC
ncbi:MAG: hypothetical protein ACTSYX_04600 [Candidatus Thorarchaeota archaeon]